MESNIYERTSLYIVDLTCQHSVVVRTPVGLSSPFSRRGAMTRVMGFLGLFSSRLCCPLVLVFIDMLLTSLTGLRSVKKRIKQLLVMQWQGTGTTQRMHSSTILCVKLEVHRANWRIPNPFSAVCFSFLLCWASLSELLWLVLLGSFAGRLSNIPSTSLKPATQDAKYGE